MNIRHLSILFVAVVLILLTPPTDSARPIHAIAASTRPMRFWDWFLSPVTQ